MLFHNLFLLATKNFSYVFEEVYLLLILCRCLCVTIAEWSFC